MLCFLDCEFTGLRQDTTLISLALVAENGKAFYAEFTDFDESQVDDWLREHVIANLWGGRHPPAECTFIRGSHEEIARAVAEWLNEVDYVSVQVVGDVLAWDWVLFCNLLASTTGALPRNVFYIPIDLSTLLWTKGYDPDVTRADFSGVWHWNVNQHNALSDAQIIRACYNRLAAEGKRP